MIKLHLALDEGLAFDPPASEVQRRAMFAARAGKSTLGIPKVIGEEFVGKDATAGNAAGVIFVAPDGSILLLRRSPTEKNFASHFALPGGKADGDETPEEAAARECEEEIGRRPETLKAVDRKITPTGMGFHTFVSPVAEKFAPKLNSEHTGYDWSSLRSLPSPLHPAVAETLKDRLGLAEDMTDEDWSGLVTGFAKWAAEEAAEPVHAKDSRLAFDRSSVRTYDADGRLHVELTNISKANVCPYLGREIPDFEALGLDPEKVYNLFRDPDELERAASTFNNIPLLSAHVAVTADDHQPDLVVGSTGTDAVFETPHLKNSLVVWAKSSIGGIEKDEIKELSSAYRYRADMTPGVHEGQNYDGVMRDIVGNHVALVENGRAGSDVVVGDENPFTSKETNMSKPIVLTRKAQTALGALLAFVKPHLAKDAALPNFYPIMAGITAKNFAAKKSAVADAIKKIAKDAKLEDIHGLLDSLDKNEVPEGADIEPNSGLPMGAEELAKKANDAEPSAALMAFLAGKLSDADMAEVQKILGGAADSLEENQTGEPEANRVDGSATTPNTKPARDADPKDVVTKKALDAAIKVSTESAVKKVTEAAKELREAERAVRPYVGDLAVACDSAEVVYRTALKMLAVDGIDGVHASALPAILKMQAIPGSRKTAAEPAFDSAGAQSFAEMFPDAARVSTL